MPTNGTKSAAKKPLPRRSASPAIWKSGFQPSRLNPGDLVVDTQTSRLNIADSAGALKTGPILLPAAAQADTAALTATAIAAAVPAAAPAGGAGAAAGAYDTAANRDAAIVTINDLRTHAIEMDLDYEAILVDVAAIRTKLNAVLAGLRAQGVILT